jgi:transcriptional regulator with XRE-family HTH domain
MKETRKELGLTQVELAVLLETTQGYVASLELGVKEPSISMLMKIKSVLNTSYDRLLEGQNVSKNVSKKAIYLL